MQIRTPDNVISQAVAMAAPTAWWKFTYNGKPRVALVIGHDRRGTGNLVCVTNEGIRSFKPGKMMGIEDFTTVGDAA